MKRLLKYIINENIRNILDVGTGSGDFIKVLSGLFPHAEITGIDPDEKSVESATGSFKDSRIHFVGMNAEMLEFPDNYFDMVTLSKALHHLPDREKSISEMKRVVKPGGYLVISEMFSDNLNPAQEVQKLFHHTRSRIDRFLGIYHHDTWTRDEIINMVKNSGISILGTFDFKKRINLINNHNELEAWVLKMKQSIDRAKGYPFYESVLPVIDEFRVKAMKYGFQPATNVVIVGTK